MPDKVTRVYEARKGAGEAPESEAKAKAGKADGQTAA